MRDTRESRLLLVLLIAVAFALITVDIRGGEDSPVDGARQGAATVWITDHTDSCGSTDPWEAMPGYWDEFVSRVGTGVSE